MNPEARWGRDFDPDELARLDICAMHIEDNFDPALRILHVFGRTYSQPHKYFCRRYSHQMWTPWEPVSAEIEGDHLAPVVWRDSALSRSG